MKTIKVYDLEDGTRLYLRQDAEGCYRITDDCNKVKVYNNGLRWFNSIEEADQAIESFISFERVDEAVKEGYTVKDLIKFLESLGDRDIEVRIDTNNDNIYLSADRYIFSGSYTLDLAQYLKNKGAKLLW